MFAVAVTAAAAVVAPTLIESPAAAAQGATSTTLHISPTSGPVGTVIEVTGVLGAGCSATNAVVSFAGAAPNTGSDTVYAPHPSSGAFAAQVVVPSWIGDGGATDGGTAVRTGTYMVQVPANCTQVQPPVVSVPFTVTSTAVPPARFVGMAPTPDGGGYWLVNAGGGVFSYGDAAFHGSLPGLGITPAAPIVAIAATPTGGGYWLAAADSGVFAFGDATFYGDTVPAPGSHTSEIPTTALLPAPDGHGYYEVHVAGTSVEAFGPSAGLRVTNPTAGTFLNAAALGPDGKGLWQAGTNGGVYAAGNASYDGSLPGLGVSPAAPIVGMASTPHGSGYWLVGADGGVYAFGDAGFHGSAAT